MNSSSSNIEDTVDVRDDLTVSNPFNSFMLLLLVKALVKKNDCGRRDECDNKRDVVRAEIKMIVVMTDGNLAMLIRGIQSRKVKRQLETSVLCYASGLIKECFDGRFKFTHTVEQFVIAFTPYNSEPYE